MKINLLLTLTFLSFITYANIKYLHGIVGMTLRDGGIGCVCHDISPTNTVNVWIEGPDTIQKGITAQYHLFMTGGPAVEGGFNVASFIGQLNSIDTLVTLLQGELTHSTPNPFENDTVKWNFSYTAPDSIMTDTLYSVGNSVNGNGNPAQDQWNFGENFVIYVVDTPVDVKEQKLNPVQFLLYQNYPNPFNPSTNIRFLITDFGFVSLKIYDILGNEVATLVNEEKQPGFYNVEFNTSSINHPLSSGIYFYQLKLEGPGINSGQGFIETKKMILLK